MSSMETTESLHSSLPASLEFLSLSTTTIGSLSTLVFEAQPVTGREHFACQDRIVSQIFILLISGGEKILSNVNVVV